MFKIPWFIPTRDEQAQYRKENREYAQREIPEIQEKLNVSQTKYFSALEKLEKTLSKEQWELWLEAKSSAQDTVFQNGRLKTLQDWISNPSLIDQ